jgi:hypothetical protein
MSLNLARLTLERLRVKALNNELSGQPYYRAGDAPNNYCYCAVGALLPAYILDSIIDEDENAEDVPTALADYMHDVRQVTGLSSRLLEDLQFAHDDRFPVDKSWSTIRERANLSVLEFTTTALSTMF